MTCEIITLQLGRFIDIITFLSSKQNLTIRSHRADSEMNLFHFLIFFDLLSNVITNLSIHFNQAMWWVCLNNSLPFSYCTIDLFCSM